MTNKRKPLGGTQYASRRGDRFVQVNFSPEEYALLAVAAEKRGWTLKGLCRRATLTLAGLDDPRPAEDTRGGVRPGQGTRQRACGIGSGSPT